MDYLQTFKNVLDLEAQAILKAMVLIEKAQVHQLIEIYQDLKSSGGKIIFCGVGKSGIIGQKLASTFSSLGLHTLVLHPTDALHGDLGNVNPQDAIVLISKSGTTEEILKLLPYLPIDRTRIIGLLGQVQSSLAEHCSLVFDCSIEKEACINNQAPTTSSTLALALGDAMAVVYEKWIGLSKEGFAINHPGGWLGKSIRLKVSHLMVPKINCPTVEGQDTLRSALLAMTTYPVGACAIIDKDGLIGLLVEADIRRTLLKEEFDLNTPVQKIMNKHPVVISMDSLALEALTLMESGERKFYVLPVVQGTTFVGMIRMHDLIQEGLKA